MKKIDYGKKVLVTNSILSVISRGASMIISFITAPLLLTLLGVEKYGVWVTLLSLVSWIYTFDLGIANGLRNKLVECLILNKYEDARKYLGVSYFLLGIASLVMLILSMLIINIIDIGAFFNVSLKDENIKWIIFVAVLFACINFVASLIRQAFYALQQSGIDAVANMVAQAIFAITLFVLSKLQHSSLLLVALFEGGAQLCKNITSSIYVFINYPNLRFEWRDIDKKYSKGILSFGIQMFVVQIAALILNTTDNLIISHYFGSEEVTPYSICYKYFGMIESVYVAVYAPLMGAYTAAYAQKDIPFINKLFRKNIIGCIIFGLFTAVATFIFKPFTVWWLGKELNYVEGLVVYIALYFFILMCTHVFSCVLTAFSMIKEVTIITILQVLVNIPVSIYCAINLEMGTVGVIMGSIVAMVIAIIVVPVKTMSILKQLNQEYKKQEGI